MTKSINDETYAERVERIGSRAKAPGRVIVAPYVPRYNKRDERSLALWTFDAEKFLDEFVKLDAEKDGVEAELRQAIVLGLVRGLSNRDVATIMGCTRENISIKYGADRRSYRGHVVPFFTDADKEAALDEIDRLSNEAWEIEEELSAMVQAALLTGQVSYRTLGESIGVTRQAVEKRFRGVRKEAFTNWGPQEWADNMAAIGARKRAVRYEVRSADGKKVSSHKKVSNALAAAKKGQVIVKVYPEGEEREVKG